MKGTSRLTICAAILVIACICILNKILRICDQYSAGAYLAAMVNHYDTHQQLGDNKKASLKGNDIGDKVIVMARLNEDNTNWVQEELPEYDSLSL